MRWYKILAQTLLMLSSIDFALAAPVAVQEREVRVSVVDAAKDRKAKSPLRWDPSDKWLASVADRTNAPPTPRSSDSGHYWWHKTRGHNPRVPTDSTIDQNSPGSTRPHIENADDLQSPSSPPGSGSTSPLSLTKSQAQIDSHSVPSEPSQDHVSSPPNLGNGLPPDSPLWSSGSTQDHVAYDLPSDAGSPSWSSGSTHWPDHVTHDLPSDSHWWSLGLTQDHAAYDSLYSHWWSPGTTSDESYTPPQGSTDNHPLPTPPLDPGPPTEPDPPPRVKRPRPEEHESESFLSKIFKGEIKGRSSGSSALNAAHG